jgi:Mg/Co/Ni transporter MgtE
VRQATEQLADVEVPAMSDQPAPARRSGFWRELSGALAVGIAVLAAVVVVFQILAWVGGMPGPGLSMVTGHLIAAALALVVQRSVDRWAGWRGAITVVGVLAVAGFTLWVFWWA